MKPLFHLLFLSVLFTSCNSVEQKQSSAEESTAEKVTTEVAPEIVKEQLQPINTDRALLATALMAAPEAGRADCKVIGYNMAGEFVTLKEGTNEFIILADDPKKKGFSAACYHKSLEPFMARGRALKLEGKSGQEIFDIRAVEMKSGELTISPGSTLQIYYSADSLYDTATSEVEGAIRRYVIYMPYSTSESTGLPEVPVASNHPWIMNPGTHRAHIMLSPMSKK